MIVARKVVRYPPLMCWVEARPMVFILGSPLDSPGGWNNGTEDAGSQCTGAQMYCVT